MAAKTDPLKQLESPVANSLAPQGGTPEGFIVFTGLPGRSNVPQSVRLYLSEELDEYVEIAASDIRHSQAIELPEAPLGVTKIWVLQTAAVRHTSVKTRSAQADISKEQMNAAWAANSFLDGSILDQMPRTSATATAAFQAKGLSWFRCCRTYPMTMVCYGIQQG